MRSHRARNQVSHRQFGVDASSPNIISIRQQIQSAAAPDDPEAALLGRQRDKLHQQLFEAAQIQRKLSGPRLLRFDTLECAREVFAAQYLSGDFAVFYEVDDKLFAAVGDITGKGAPAGMWFTHLVGLVQRYAVAGADPSQIATEVNAHLCSLRPLGPFVSMFLAQLNPHSGDVTYCNAGHFPPVLLRGRQKWDLDVGGPLLGALPEGQYHLARQSLQPDDTLVAYSDGVIECRNAGDEEFGVDRLVSAASELACESTQMMLLTLLGAVQDFGAGNLVSDDMSLMVIRRVGPLDRAMQQSFGSH